MAQMSFRAYAKHRGVSVNAVSKAVKAGRITAEVNKDGKRWINAEKADKQWAENTSGRKDEIVAAPVKPATARAPAAKPAHKAAPAAEEPEEEAPEGEQPEQKKNTYAFSRGIREGFMAKLARLEFEEKAGRLVPADKVKIDAYKIGRTVRDSILNVADQLSHDLAAEGDPHKIHIMLTTELRKALDSLEGLGNVSSS
jgi:hypothetical protein